MDLIGQLKFIVQEATLGTENELTFRNLVEPCGLLNQYHGAVLPLFPHFIPKRPLIWSGVKKGVTLIGSDFPTAFCDSLRGVTLSYMNTGRNSPGAKLRENHMNKMINK